MVTSAHEDCENSSFEVVPWMQALPADSPAAVSANVVGQRAKGVSA
jgi:hypothetical protein